MLLNQKYEIFPTEDQKETLDCWLQYCRQTYNSALLDKQRMYKQSKTPYNRLDMQRQLKLKPCLPKRNAVSASTRGIYSTR
ncbi:MAG TPA: helix-turn-helix domain-containing protein [Candidatus Avamphibacillus sp.]|nr:helix-turn-helix domain-containing protein [Candidatus Avamphibacillus sp.]